MVVLGANTVAMNAVEQTNVIKVDEHNHYHGFNFLFILKQFI